ncbi:hypothetical protein DSECCO2_550430 [anaerobic digester metagenome]
MNPPIRRCGKAGQKACGLLRRSKRRAMNRTVQVRQVYAFNVTGLEDVHIFRPCHRGIGTVGTVKIMVPRRDEHRDTHAPQAPGQLLRRLPKTVGSIKQVAGKEH